MERIVFDLRTLWDGKSPIELTEVSTYILSNYSGKNVLK